METLDYGSLSMAKGMSIGYLPQDGLSLAGRTVFAEAMSVFDQLRQMEQELEDLHHSLGEMARRVPSTRRRRIARITSIASSEIATAISPVCVHLVNPHNLAGRDYL